jgi:hypothetical protein
LPETVKLLGNDKPANFPLPGRGKRLEGSMQPGSRWPIPYDSEIVIREPESLPYGGVYQGHEGAKQHAGGYALTWGDFQTEQKTDAVFLDAGDHVIVLWRQSGLDTRSGKKARSPGRECLQNAWWKNCRIADVSGHIRDFAVPGT